MAEHLASELLLDVYACARDAGRWRQVLDRICGSLDVRSAVVQALDRDGDMLCQRWTARDSTSQARAAMHDALVNNMANPRLDLRLGGPIPSGSLVRDSDRFPPGSRAYAALQERLAAIGLGQALGVVFELSPGRFFTLLLHRASEDRRPFAPAEEGFLRELAPHLEQAARLSASIEQASAERATLDGVMDQLRTGVILCDGEGRIRWMNGAAAAVLQCSPCLSARNSRLCCTDARDQRAVAALLAQTSSAPVTVGLQSDEPAQLIAVPTRSETQPSLTALILCRPRDVPPISAKDAAALFGLSPAEGRLASALCAGMSVADFALSRGISVGTARVQLKQVLHKTRTRRQSELVRLIGGSILAHALGPQALPQLPSASDRVSLPGRTH